LTFRVELLNFNVSDRGLNPTGMIVLEIDLASFFKLVSPRVFLFVGFMRIHQHGLSIQRVDGLVMQRQDMNVDRGNFSDNTGEPTKSSGVRVDSDDIHLGFRFEGVHELLIFGELLMGGRSE
jgi:hypothetical protein